MKTITLDNVTVIDESSVNRYTPMFVTKDDKICGMITQKGLGWAFDIGGEHRQMDYYGTRKDCVEGAIKEGYQIYIELCVECNKKLTKTETKMRRVTISETVNVSIEDIDIDTPIFALNASQQVCGMVVQDNDGWVVKTGGGKRSTCHYGTRTACIIGAMKAGYFMAVDCEVVV